MKLSKCILLFVSAAICNWKFEVSHAFVWWRGGDQMQLAHEPNTKPVSVRSCPEEWGVSKLAPAQVEGRGGALFQECLAQKVIPGVKIYENFIKHLFVPWYSPDSREKKKKRGQAFWKTKGAWSMDFSFWETHLKIHLKSQRYTHSFTSNTLQFCFLIGLSVGKRGWHAFHIDIIQHI